jgi:uncharacterized coiled-coil protein SlyX
MGAQGLHNCWQGNNRVSGENLGKTVGQVARKTAAWALDEMEMKGQSRQLCLVESQADIICSLLSPPVEGVEKGLGALGRKNGIKDTVIEELGKIGHRYSSRWIPGGPPRGERKHGQGDTMEKRLEKVEMSIGFLSKGLDDVSAMVVEHARQLRALQDQVENLQRVLVEVVASVQESGEMEDKGHA